MDISSDRVVVDFTKDGCIYVEVVMQPDRWEVTIMNVVTKRAVELWLTDAQLEHLGEAVEGLPDELRSALSNKRPRRKRVGKYGRVAKNHQA